MYTSSEILGQRVQSACYVNQGIMFIFGKRCDLEAVQGPKIFRHEGESQFCSIPKACTFFAHRHCVTVCVNSNPEVYV